MYFLATVQFPAICAALLSRKIECDLAAAQSHARPIMLSIPLPSRAHAQRRVIVVGRSVGQSVGLSVGLSVCPHVFSRTVAVEDTKRGYVGMCNGRSAQQES